MGVAASTTEAQERCTNNSLERLAGYAAPVTSRCKCVAAIEGPWGRLKAMSPVTEDAEYFANAIVVIRQRGREDRLPGVFAHNRGAFRLFNDKSQLVYVGAGIASSAGNSKRDSQVTCFGSAASGNGTYGLVSRPGHKLGSYGVGTFRLSGDERVDFVHNISLVELLQRHPDFPE